MKPAAVLLMLAASLLSSKGQARAHRLLADATPRPFGQVQVESYFETDQIPYQARVKAFDASGKVVGEGVLNDRGIFLFAYDGPGPLHIVVEAGEGHRAEANVPAEDLRRCLVNTRLAALTPLPSPLLAAALWQTAPITPAAEADAVPLVKHRTGLPIGKLLLGIGILAGIAILAMVWRKVRR